jgi:hypothetical protein
MSIGVYSRCEQMAPVNISYLHRGKQFDIIGDSMVVNNPIGRVFKVHLREAGKTPRVSSAKPVDNLVKEYVRFFR